MFVDTHCHLTMLDLTPYDGDLDLALAQAREAGVHRFMSISVDIDDHIELAKIAARHNDVGYSVGVHPCEDPETMARATTDYLIELAQPEKVWAIGETGLDYFHSTDFIAEQKDCFCTTYSCFTSCKKTSCCAYPFCQARYCRYYSRRKIDPWYFALLYRRLGNGQSCLRLRLLCVIFRDCIF